MDRPEFHLFTAPTMNGWKPLIFFEEADLAYELTHVRFSKREQKSPEYLRLNPNGRIPTLVDRGRDGHVVFESGAILWYLAERTGRFLPGSDRERSDALQWMMFQMSGIGPMMGQAMYFQRIAEPQGHRDDFAIRRYVDESRRLLEVLDRRLSEREYLVGDAYSIVDMATFPWVRSYPWAKVSIDGLGGLQAWLARVGARPAVRRAVLQPEPFPAFFGEGDDEAQAAAQARNAARFEIE